MYSPICRMKSALLEREVKDITAELHLIDQAVSLYPTFEKFYLMAGQACDEVLNDNDRARDYYQKGLKQCPTSVPLWIHSVRLEERMKGVSKARGMIELARLKMPKNDLIWLEAVRLERRNGNMKLVENLMARALQECPNSGVLWAEEIMHCPHAQQRSKSVDALKKCDNDPHVIVALARLFEKDRKYAKARKWFDRAVTLNPDLGDSWIYYFAFELRQGVAEGKEGGGGGTALGGLSETILSRCVAADPRHGELWCAVSKQTEFRRLDTANVLKRAAERLLTSQTAHVLQTNGSNETANNADDE